MPKRSHQHKETYRLQGKVSTLKYELREQKERVERLRQELETYEMMLEDKDCFISEVKQDVLNAKQMLEHEYKKYEKMIREYDGIHSSLRNEVKMVKSSMFYRTLFTIFVIIILLLIAVI